MVRVIITYRTTTFKADMVPNATVMNLFQRLNFELHFEGGPSDYLIWDNSQLHPIDNTLLTRIQTPSVISLHLVKKEVGIKMAHFLNHITPSIISQVAEFDYRSKQLSGFDILHAIHFLHTQIINFSEQDTSDAILGVIPFERIEALKGDAIVVELVKWFKEEFFTFVKDIKCHNCQGETYRLPGISPVSQTESKHLAKSCELYKCKTCGAITRFPRYNDVAKLIETRKGRCGEFANTFAGILNALGLDVRLVDDMNDHVWVEFWSEEKQRYVHVDPCENIVDKPLTYESGWGKKETWVIAVGEGQVTDVTQKYTQHLDQCINRRSRMCPEETYQKIIKFKNEQFRASLIPEDKVEIAEKQKKDYEFMQVVRTETTAEEQRPRISGNE